MICPCATFLSPPVPKQIDYSIYHKHPEELTEIDEWGVGHQRGSVAHFSRFISPMASFTDPQQVWDYPFPDILNPALWESVHTQVQLTHREGRAAAFHAIQVFEPAWYLRGLDNLLADFLCDEDMANACMQKMTQIQVEISRQAAKCGVDIIIFGDDVGTQRAMMMSPETWRQWIKPAAAATISAAKEVNPDVLAMYHSDGKIEEIIPELIEIGVDILNPVQPECVDPIQLKKQYGEKLSFWGTIGTQTTMPFGTPSEVAKTVHAMIESVGKNGGFTIAPTHILEPEVPWENIEAFLDAVHQNESLPFSL